MSRKMSFAGIVSRKGKAAGESGPGRPYQKESRITDEISVMRLRECG